MKVEDSTRAGTDPALSVMPLKHDTGTLRELLLQLQKHRSLTLELAKREVTDRYAGQVLGALWAVGHPLIVLAVYIVVFVFVLNVRVGGTVEMPLDYTTYLLSGLIPWLGFQESMMKGSTVIVTNATLVTQAVFPIEILPVKGVLTSLLTMAILFVGLVLYVLVSHHALPWTYALLPVLVACQALAMVGVSYVLASLGVYFRDLKDIVQVFGFLGIYLMPVFYLPEAVPAVLRPLLYLNPFSYLAWTYQDALYFGRIEHWWAWIVVVVASVSCLVMGYRVFQKLRVMFGHVL